MGSDKFGSQLDRKSKTFFFIFLNVYVSWNEWDKIMISQLSPAKFRYFSDQSGPKGDFMEMNYKIEYHKHLDLQKVDEKNGVICLVSLFPPEYSP